ncbi:MAG: hypothetical protein RhofKO_19180 [Rhodothermales bacterium]
MTLRCYAFFLVGCLISTSALAQTDESGARAMALGGALSALANVTSVTANPASFSQTEQRTVSLFTSQAFGLSELRLGTFDAILPTSMGHVAVGGRTFGFENYRENRFTLGYSRGLALGTRRTFHVGLTADYYTLAIPNYGSATALGIGFGWMTEVVERVQVGAMARNINGPSFTDEVGLERVLSVGLAYTASDDVLLVLDAHKESRFPLAVRGGIEFAPIKAVALRWGFTSEPVQYSAGVGVRLAALHADVAGSYHEDLGWSPALALSVLW